jgi:hypothetical protein
LAFFLKINQVTYYINSFFTGQLFHEKSAWNKISAAFNKNEMPAVSLGMEPSLFLAVFPYAFLASFPIVGIIFVTKWSLDDRKRKSKGKQAAVRL